MGQEKNNKKDKDPAFLFYSSDFLTGTILMTNEQIGKYIKLLCLQHQKGRLSKSDFFKIADEKDDEIKNKFLIDKNGLFYNKRLEEEALKRKKYCLSRRNNRRNKNKDKKNLCKTYEKHMCIHMENENEDENEDENVCNNVSKNKKSKKHKYGSYKNVLLADDELEKLKDKFGDNGAKSWIARLDEGIELKGYKYKSHYLAILTWSRRKEKTSDNDMSLEEREKIAREM